MTESAPNQFIEGFMIPNQGLLDQLSDAAADIRSEQEGWLQSGAVEELADRKLRLAGWDGVSPLSSKERQATIVEVRTRLFGTATGLGDAAKTDHFVKQKVLGQMSYQQRKEVEALVAMTDEHQSQYRRSTREAAQRQTELGLNLVGLWGQFMGEDWWHFVSFREFLSQEKSLPLRETHRPFLEAIGCHRNKNQRGENLLVDAATEAVSRACDNPKAADFDQFIQELEQAQNSHHKKPENGALEWLRFLVFPLVAIDSRIVVDRIRTSRIFPADLKRLYAAYLQAKVGVEVNKIHPLLTAYEEKPHALTYSLQLKTYQKKRGGRIEVSNKISSRQQTPEIPPKPDYLLMLEGERTASPETLAWFITEAAQKQAPHDPKMEADIRIIIEAVRKDPYGFGVGKLPVHTVPSPYSAKRVPLWHFRAGKRPGIGLLHPESPRLRAIYYFDRNLDPRAVILKEVIHHDVADRKYS